MPGATYVWLRVYDGISRVLHFWAVWGPLHGEKAADCTVTTFTGILVLHSAASFNSFEGTLSAFMG